MVSEFTPTDLSVIIPTIGRWPILARTLNALRQQTVRGFEVLVVIDGADRVPDLQVPSLCREHEGPASARNAGVAAVSTRLVLFLGDDMVPTPHFVSSHLAAHNRDPARAAAVLGHVAWHPEVAGGRLQRWLEWSATQFDYRGLVAGADAQWPRFYSSNVSLKRQFLIEAGGFDPDFIYYYEDLDCGYRLGEHGMRLRYEPQALTHHLHAYDWESVVRRFDGIALGERIMETKHAWFRPFFLNRAREALARRPVSALWPGLVDRIPQRPQGLRATAERRADTWYYRRLGPRYMALYEAAGELDELKWYLGRRYEPRKLFRHEEEVEREEEAAPNELSFYRTSDAYLYDLTVFAMSGTKLPYHSDLEELVPSGARLLDYGCGIGSDGLRLLRRGYRVEFADFDNPSTRYLRWRLERRGINAPVHDVERDVPGGFDAVYCFDVVEHVDDPLAFLAALELLAPLVVVNFVAPAPGDTHLHKPLDIPALLDYVERRELVRYRRYHQRSHLVAYRGSSPTSSVRSKLQRRLGALYPQVTARLSPLYP